jgi:hypothetical protein
MVNGVRNAYIKVARPPSGINVTKLFSSSLTVEQIREECTSLSSLSSLTLRLASEATARHSLPSLAPGLL